MSSTSMDRREFLQDLAAGGLVLVVTATGCGRFSDRYAAGGAKGGAPSDAASNEPPFAPAVYLRIGTNGNVTAIVHRSEMGQGTKTTLAMVLADELEANWARVRVEQAPGDEKRTVIRTRTDHGAFALHANHPRSWCTGRAHVRELPPHSGGASPSRTVRAERAPGHPRGSADARGYRIWPRHGRCRAAKDSSASSSHPSSVDRQRGPHGRSLDMTVGRATYGIDQQVPG